jgi:DNA replication ATP-dependent helicase Dna2
VERFQGQERDVMIASFALGDPDAIREEDEFLMSLNRFNVMASRARAKLIVFVSQEIIDYLSDDVEVLRDSRLVKLYAESFCRHRRDMVVGWVDDRGRCRSVTGSFRWRN